MEIKSIQEHNNYYTICRDDGVMSYSRKHIVWKYDPPLTSEEEIIGALCRKIMREEEGL